MTEKQASFLQDLMARRVIPANLQNLDFTTVSVSEASNLIDQMKAQPWKPAVKSVPAAEVKEAVPVGFYYLDGEVYRVKASRENKARRYAYIFKTEGKGGSYEYTRGAIFRLDMSHKLTREQASAVGHQTGVCCLCGRELTDATSVAQGFGPVCAKYV